MHRLVLLCALLRLAVSIYAPPWQQNSGNAQHNGSSALVGSRRGALRWNVTITDPTSLEIHGSSVPTIDEDGVAYVGTADQLYAFNVTDGTLKWRFDATARFFYATMIGANGVLFAWGYAVDLWAFARANGTLLWQYKVTLNQEYPPVLAADGCTLYAGVERIDACGAAPRRVWYSGGGGPVSLTPDESAVIMLGSAYDSATGRQFPVNVTVDACGQIDGGVPCFVAVGRRGLMYACSTRTRALVALNATAAAFASRATAPVWRHNITAAGDECGATPAVHSSAADGSDVVVFVTMAGTATALNESGAVLWTRELGERVTAAPVVDAARTLYVATMGSLEARGSVFCLDAATGVTLFQYRHWNGRGFPDAPAIARDGTVVIVTADPRTPIPSNSDAAVVALW